MAIALALVHAGIGVGDEILLPAYHCISMVEPVLWTGATPRFYAIHEDTSANLDHAQRCMTPAVKAMLVTHFFGFLQDMPALRRFCDRNGVLLIEDCAHAFFGRRAGHAVGSHGDYAVASAWKFFPVSDGGCLASNRRDVSHLTLRREGIGYEARQAVHTLERALDYGRLRLLWPLIHGPLRARKWLLAKRRRYPAAPACPNPVENPEAPSEFDPHEVGQSMSRSSRSILRWASRQRIVVGRRDNYRFLLRELGAEPGARPLHPVLPDEIVPQVFPLVMDAPEYTFQRLKNWGVPIIRFGEYLWPGMPPDTCATTRNLSRRVFQFPCHQELTPAELEWMVDAIRRVLTEPASQGPRD